MTHRLSIGGLAGLAGCLLFLSAWFIGATSAMDRSSPAAQSSDTNDVATNVVISTTFTYQGQLKQDGHAANGLCDMAFRLFDDAEEGNLAANPYTKTVTVQDGLFTTGLNFGDGAFRGQALWLDVRLRCPGGAGAFTTLSPRQALTPAPHALSFGAPGGVYGYLYESGSGNRLPTIGFNTYDAPDYRAGAEGYGGILQFLNADGKLTYYTGSYAEPGETQTSVPRWVIDSFGRMGIGTTSPQQLLEVNGVTSMGLPGGLYGYRVGGVSGPYYPTLGFNTYGPLTGSSYLAGLAGYGGLFQFQNSDGKLIYYTGSNVTAGAAHVLTPQFVIDSSGNVGVGTTVPLADLHVDGGIRGNSLTSPTDLFVNATGRIALRTTPSGGYAERVSILSNGYVGVGTTNPQARLHVVATDANNSNDMLLVTDGFGTETLRISNQGWVYLADFEVGGLLSHLCRQDGNGLIGTCGSAAEYAPSIDAGLGHPQAGDLVSMAPDVANPYGDEHAPFVVQKSSKACDANLLGFIVDPALGADGDKKNEHYLPLAIYGYFPAKVSVENGAIRRGDPLTSSSTPGHAMKATGACRIIGYALTDTDKAGIIQVFANLGENGGSEAIALRDQVTQLQEQNAAFEARLAALEAALEAKAQAGSFSSAGALQPSNLSAALTLLAFGWVWIQRRRQGGTT